MRDVSGKYRLINKLGRGGMGQVWGGVRLGREDMIMPCAIKVLHPALAQTEENRQRFFNEARIAAQLDHGRIVKVTDTSEVHGCPCLVMEWVDGVNLREFIDKIGVRLDLDVCLHVVGEVLAALEYAHERTVGGEDAGVIHYDVTPSNILISSSGEVKLTDFGIARFAATVEGTMSRSMGTPRYMSPEQLCGRAKRESDIYSLGVVLQELLDGARFLDGCDRLQLQTLVLEGHVPELSREGTPAWVDQLRRQMLGNQPDDRPRAADARALILQKTTHYHLAGQQLRELYQRFVGERRSGLTELNSTKALSRPRHKRGPPWEGLSRERATQRSEQAGQGPEMGHFELTPAVPVLTEAVALCLPPSRVQTIACQPPVRVDSVDATEVLENPAPPRRRSLRLVYALVGASLILFGISVGLLLIDREGEGASASPLTALVEGRPTESPMALAAALDESALAAALPKPAFTAAPPEPVPVPVSSDPNPKPEIEPAPQPPRSEPEPEPPRPPKIEVTFEISGVTSAEIKVGSRLLTYNHVAFTKLSPRTQKYPIRWRESPSRPWHRPGSLRVEALPKGLYYDVRLGPKDILVKKAKKGSAQ